MCFWCLVVSSFLTALLLYLSTSLIIHWSGSDSALHTLFENQKSLAVITPTLPHSIRLACLLPTYIPTHPPTFTQSISTAFVSALRASTLVPESTSAQADLIPHYIYSHRPVIGRGYYWRTLNTPDLFHKFELPRKTSKIPWCISQQDNISKISAQRYWLHLPMSKCKYQLSKFNQIK